MNRWLRDVHKLFLCVGFFFSSCYSSQQLTQNNIWTQVLLAESLEL